MFLAMYFKEIIFSYLAWAVQQNITGYVARYVWPRSLAYLVYIWLGLITFGLHSQMTTAMVLLVR